MGCRRRGAANRLQQQIRRRALREESASARSRSTHATRNCLPDETSYHISSATAALTARCHRTWIEGRTAARREKRSPAPQTFQAAGMHGSAKCVRLRYLAAIGCSPPAAAQTLPLRPLQWFTMGVNTQIHCTAILFKNNPTAPHTTKLPATLFSPPRRRHSTQAIVEDQWRVESPGTRQTPSARPCSPISQPLGPPRNSSARSHRLSGTRHDSGRERR